MIKYKKIFLDAGHGGKDPGAVNTKLKMYESKIALQIAKELRKLFRSKKRKFIWSRKIDKYVELNSRWLKCNLNNCDLSICIHLNSCTSEDVRGAEVFYYHDNSQLLAETISARLAYDLNIPNRGAKKYKWAMCYNTNCPSVLIECDFISNNKFATLCKNKKYIKEIAKSIYIGIRHCEG